MEANFWIGNICYLFFVLFENRKDVFRMVECFTGTRFRPLSLNIPKPLFPLAGQAMVHHPISACKRVYSWVHLDKNQQLISSSFAFLVWLAYWIMEIAISTVDSKPSTDLSGWFLWGAWVCIVCLLHLQWTKSPCQVTSWLSLY